MKKVVTVDFDDTLCSSSFDGAWGKMDKVPITRVIDFVKKLHTEGNEIHIVTFRMQKDKKEVQNFCRIHKIPISTIVCTNWTNKLPFIKALNSSLHIDDDVDVCTLCIKAGINVLLVDWEQEKIHPIANSFDKI